MAISASTMNKSDMNGTSMDATLPIRLMPPMMMTAAIAATIMPTISLTISTFSAPVMRVYASDSEPEILLVCTPLIPMAARMQKTEAIYASHFHFKP